MTPKTPAELAEKVLFNLLEFLKESGQQELVGQILKKNLKSCAGHKEKTCPICSLKMLISQIGRRLRSRQALSRRLQTTLLRLQGTDIRKIALGPQNTLDLNSLTLENTQALLSYLATVDIIGSQILELKDEELKEFRTEMIVPALGELPEELVLDHHRGQVPAFVFLDFVRRYTSLGVKGLDNLGDPDRLLESILQWTSAQHKKPAPEKGDLKNRVKNGNLNIPIEELPSAN